MEEIRTSVEHFRRTYEAVTGEVRKVIVGHTTVIEEVMTCLLAGGHGLVEGVPGLGKTLLVRTLSQALELRFSRVQFTPDLMPADIIGTNVIEEDERGGRRFRFEPGPVFGNVVLADEINRATPKTQSALLEAMQESTVTVGGVRHELTSPFMVLATQNPIEMEGTYPLPEAQLDRFMLKIRIGNSSAAELVEIVGRTTAGTEPSAKPVATGADIARMRRLVREVPVASHACEYVAELVLATHPGRSESPEVAKRYIRYGASPRGAQAVVLAAKVRALVAGRHHVSFEDVKAVMLPALRHRIIFTFEGQAENLDPDAVLRDIASKVRQPEG
jgi:MoxR-like ATPase